MITVMKRRMKWSTPCYSPEKGCNSEQRPQWTVTAERLPLSAESLGRHDHEGVILIEQGRIVFEIIHKQVLESRIIA